MTHVNKKLLWNIKGSEPSSIHPLTFTLQARIVPKQALFLGMVGRGRGQKGHASRSKGDYFSSDKENNLNEQDMVITMIGTKGVNVDESSEMGFLR